jgi:hypothetical protein
MRLGDVVDAEVSDNSSIPEGWYHIKVDNRSAVKMSKDKGKPYLGLWCVIQKGEHKGRLLFDNKSFQSSSVSYLKPLLKVVGKSDDYDIVIDADGDISIPVDEFIDKEYMVRLTYWKNKTTGKPDPKIVAYKTLEEAGETATEEGIPF